MKAANALNGSLIENRTVNILKLVFVFFVLNTFNALGQTLVEEQLQCLDAHFYGTSDRLVNGRHYRPEHPMTTGHPYFQLDVFHQGALYTKGKKYEQVELLYNVERDQLIVKRPLTSNNVVQIIASPTLVDSFILNGQRFVNKRYLEIQTNDRIYLKKLYHNKWQLYLQVEKDYYPVFSDKHPYGRYGKLERTYYLRDDNGASFRFNSRRSFLKIFGKNKKTVKRYMKELDMRFTKARDLQWYKLMKFCENLDAS